MKTVVITDGIGRGLAQAYLRRGDQVVVVGTSQAKGDAFLAAARDLGAQGRAWSVQADLGLVEENRRLVDRLSAQFDALDVLVLGAAITARPGSRRATASRPTSRSSASAATYSATASSAR